MNLKIKFYIWRNWIVLSKVRILKKNWIDWFIETNYLQSQKILNKNTLNLSDISNSLEFWKFSLQTHD